MGRREFDLDNIRIASPCSMSWKQMSGDEQARHCDDCKLNVYNISAMSRAEATSLITNRESRLCVRLYRRTDGTVLTQDCPVGLRAVRKRIAVFAGAALTAILGLFSISYGQRKDDKIVDAKNVDIRRVINRNSSQALITVQVLDPNGALIPGSTVVLIDGKIETDLITNADGVVVFKDTAPGNYQLRIDANGFRRKQIKNLEVRASEALDARITLSVGEAMGLLLDDEDELLKTTSTITYTIRPGDHY